jgi:hypothetical protein
VLLAMLAGLLFDLPFVALSFVLTDAKSPYKSFSKEDA